MMVLHVAHVRIVGRANVVVRSEDQARPFASEKCAKRLNLFGSRLLIGNQVVESVDHQRIGVREDPLVNRQLLPRLIHSLVDGHGLARYFANSALKVHQRKVEQF